MNLFIRILLYPYIDLGSECAMGFVRNLDDFNCVLAADFYPNAFFGVRHFRCHEVTVCDIK